VIDHSQERGPLAHRGRVVAQLHITIAQLLVEIVASFVMDYRRTRRPETA
jgi:hypothetical protein